MRRFLAALPLCLVLCWPAVAQTHDATIAGYVRHVERGGGSVSRSCLTSETRALLSRLEIRFGAVQVISTCRAGAVIAGTHRPSYHRYGMAVDFKAPTGRKSEVVRWLASQGALAMTYARMAHVHFNLGQGGRIARQGRKRLRVAAR